MKQLFAVIGMNIRSIPQRAGMSIATIVSVALMVGVLLGFLAMANGFRATLSGSGADDVAIILRGGSQTELNSVLARDDARLWARDGRCREKKTCSNSPIPVAMAAMDRAIRTANSSTESWACGLGSASSTRMPLKWMRAGLAAYSRRDLMPSI